MTPEQLQKMQQLKQQLAQVTAERDALQKRVDEALKIIGTFYCENDNDYFELFQNLDLSDLIQINSVIKILTGEGG